MNHPVERGKDMKGIGWIAVFIFVFSMTATCLAADTGVSKSTEAVVLIKTGLDKNFNQLQDMSGSLTLNERTLLYEAYKKSTTAPLLLNLFIGMFGVGGIGSFVQGDMTGGTVAICGQFGGEILLFAGLAIIASNRGGVYTVDMSAPANITAAIFEVVGGAATLGFWIFGLVRPFQYAGTYNEKLKSALNLNPLPFSFNILPLVTPTAPGSRESAYGAQLQMKW